LWKHAWERVDFVEDTVALVVAELALLADSEKRRNEENEENEMFKDKNSQQKLKISHLKIIFLFVKFVNIKVGYIYFKKCKK
jgi:hypothetical protein